MDLTTARKGAQTDADARSIAWAQDRIEELECALKAAQLQLEYLDEKYPSSATSSTVLVRVRLALAGCGTYDHELTK